MERWIRTLEFVDNLPFFNSNFAQLLFSRTYFKGRCLYVWTASSCAYSIVKRFFKIWLRPRLIHRFASWVEFRIPSECSPDLEIFTTLSFLWIKLYNVWLVSYFDLQFLRFLCIIDIFDRTCLMVTVGGPLSLDNSLVAIPDRPQYVFFYHSVEEFLLGYEPIVQLLLLNQLIDGAILPLRVLIAHQLVELCLDDSFNFLLLHDLQSQVVLSLFTISLNSGQHSVVWLGDDFDEVFDSDFDQICF